MFCAELWLHGQRWAVPLGMYLFSSTCYKEMRRSKYQILHKRSLEVTFWQENKKENPCSLCAGPTFFHRVKKLGRMAAGRQNINSIRDRKRHVRSTLCLSQGDGNCIYMYELQASEWEDCLVVTMSRHVTKPALWLNLSITKLCLCVFLQLTSNKLSLEWWPFFKWNTWDERRFSEQ